MKGRDSQISYRILFYSSAHQQYDAICVVLSTRCLQDERSPGIPQQIIWYNMYNPILLVAFIWHKYKKYVECYDNYL